ncbi:MAG: PASTA domain-containing protein [Firmicutes bacterium]|nr:PASTA domain-containing protein [Bacillota bacterium]
MRPKKLNRIDLQRRITLVLVICLCCFSLVVVWLAKIQLIQGAALQEKANETRTRDLPVAAARGAIYDCNGNKLAFSITADSVSVSPPDIKAAGQEKEVASFLAQALSLDEQTVYQKVTSDVSFVWIQRKVDFDVAARIKEQIAEKNYVGINLIEETQRYYPNGVLAAHVIGFSGIDNEGLEGVEKSMDGVLAGTDGRIVGEYDNQGRLITQAEYEYIAPTDGSDVYLTIDENIQFFAERELDALMNSDTPPKGAGVLIMRPQTGEILAAAYRNAFDPNHYGDFDASAYRNFLISDSYEPGSVFKIITGSTALEEGVADLSSRYYDPGYIMVNGTRIGCWTNNPHGSQSFAEAVKNSCNPAFVTIGLSIEEKQQGLFYKYIRAFGFGQNTGVDLPGEAPGILIDEENVHKVEIGTISIGQGIAVTPIQMITAVSAVANGGVLLKPQIVSKVVDSDGTVRKKAKAEPVRQVISAETSATMLEVLQGVVEEGSGTKAAIPGYKVAGKTGTAQKAKNGVYAPGKYVGSFAGIVPADHPELVCLVIVDEPSGVYYGSQVAAPVFSAVVSDCLRYLGIAPSIENEVKPSVNQIKVIDVTNLSAEGAEQALRLSGFQVEVAGSGDVVVSQLPAAGSKADEGSLVSIELGEAPETGALGMITVPDLSGKRMSEVASLLSAMGLKLTYTGSGEAVEQKPEAGEKVQAGSTVNVRFNE